MLYLPDSPRQFFTPRIIRDPLAIACFSLLWSGVRWPTPWVAAAHRLVQRVCRAS